MNDVIPQIEQQRQNWWAQVYQSALDRGAFSEQAKANADAALNAFDEQFYPRSTQELQAIFAKGQP